MAHIVAHEFIAQEISYLSLIVRRYSDVHYSQSLEPVEVPPSSLSSNCGRITTTVVVARIVMHEFIAQEINYLSLAARRCSDVHYSQSSEPVEITPSSLSHELISDRVYIYIVYPSNNVR